MTMTRRKYTTAFKEKAVKLVVEEGYKVSEAARKLGISANMLSRWRSEMKQPPEARQAAANDRQELNRLRKENRRLRMEQEILKKQRPFCATIGQRYQFIRQQMKAYPAAIMCRLFHVSRSGFYCFMAREAHSAKSIMPH